MNEEKKEVLSKALESKGNMDLPQSIGFMIARLIHQKFPHNIGAVNRDGTIILVFKDRVKANKHKEIKIKFKGLRFKYVLVEKQTSKERKKCKECGNYYQRTTFSLIYTLKEVFQGWDDITDKYAKGGELSEGVKGVSALRKQVREEMRKKELKKEEKSMMVV